MKLVDMVMKLRVHKPLRLLDVDLFIEYTIQEGTLDVHLEQFELFEARDTKKKADGFVSWHMSKRLIKVHALDLRVTLNNQPSFVPREVA